MKDEADRWQIIVKAEGDGPPVYVRLRRLIKHMLRAFGIRILDMRALPKDQQKGDQG